MQNADTQESKQTSELTDCPAVMAWLDGFMSSGTSGGTRKK